MAVALERTSPLKIDDRRQDKKRVLEVLLSTIDDYDAYSGGHSQRVARYSAHLARLLGLSYPTVQLVRSAGFVHDIGKILIPDWIVQKPAPLNDEEREIIQMHPELGARMLARRPAMRELVPAVLHHHERWDGSGYPHGLSGTDIPLESRIIFVADAFDAMTSERPYGRVFTPQEAGAELRRCAGTDFDPAVVRVMRLALNSGNIRRSPTEIFSPSKTSA